MSDLGTAAVSTLAGAGAFRAGVELVHRKYGTRGILTAVDEGGIWLYEIFQPDVLLGWVPLFGVQELDITRSQQDLKYRAVGSAFLAQQEGGDVAVRIDGIFHGPMSGLYLTLVHLLSLQGKGREQNLSDILPPPLLDNPAFKKLLEYTSMTQRAHGNPLLDRGPKHEVFTFFSKHFILFNMYIETFRVETAVKHGRDVYQYTIMLRRYIPPPPLVLKKGWEVHLENYEALQDAAKQQLKDMIDNEGNHWESHIIEWIAKESKWTDKQKEKWINDHIPDPLDPAKVGTDYEGLPVEIDPTYEYKADIVEIQINNLWRVKEFLLEFIYSPSILTGEIYAFARQKFRNGQVSRILHTSMASHVTKPNILETFIPVAAKRGVTIQDDLVGFTRPGIPRKHVEHGPSQVNITTYEIPRLQPARTEYNLKFEFNKYGQMILWGKPLPSGTWIHPGQWSGIEEEDVGLLVKYEEVTGGIYELTLTELLGRWMI